MQCRPRPRLEAAADPGVEVGTGSVPTSQWPARRGPDPAHLRVHRAGPRRFPGAGPGPREWVFARRALRSRPWSLRATPSPVARVSVALQGALVSCLDRGHPLCFRSLCGRAGDERGGPRRSSGRAGLRGSYSQSSRRRSSVPSGSRTRFRRSDFPPSRYRVGGGGPPGGPGGGACREGSLAAAPGPRVSGGGEARKHRTGPESPPGRGRFSRSL